MEDNNDLLRVDRHGDMFSNFFSNLWSQLKDPTRFHFFRVPEEEVQRVAADFRQRESQSVKTGEPLVAQYEVQPLVQAQQQTQAGQQQQPEGAPQQSAGQTEQNPQYKYRPEDIDWNSLAALGVQREQIEGNGMLDQMLRVAVTRNFAASLFRNIKYFTLRKLYLCRKWMQKRLQKTTTTGITLPNFDFLA